MGGTSNRGDSKCKGPEAGRSFFTVISLPFFSTISSVFSPTIELELPKGTRTGGLEGIRGLAT